MGPPYKSSSVSAIHTRDYLGMDLTAKGGTVETNQVNNNKKS